ncbi:MAG: MFS transporter, partial [Dehalococcoidales bacterium]|nr:MFS transporter [Dehalococcoidales bacterium]
PRGFIAEIRRAKLGNYFLFTSLFHVTVNLCGPLYAVYMLRELHLSYLSYTIVISMEFLARIVSAPFWGRYADKVGNIRVISIVSRVIPLIPICWLFYHHAAYLAIVQTVSGVCWGAFDLCTQGYIYRVAPAPKRLHYIVYNKSLLLLCTAAGGLIGAVFYEGGFPIFGSSILGIFLLSGIFRLLVVFVMSPKIVDLAVEFGAAPISPAFDEEAVRNMLSAKTGLYYRHPQREIATGQPFPIRAKGSWIQGVSSAGTCRQTKPASYIQRLYQRSYPSYPPPGAVVTDNGKPFVSPGRTVTGLYYARKREEKSNPGSSKTRERTIEKKTAHDSARNGLYYNSLEQRRYLDKLRKSYLDIAAKTKNIAVFRKGIYCSLEQLRTRPNRGSSRFGAVSPSSSLVL